MRKYILLICCLTISVLSYSQTTFCSKIPNEHIIQKQYITISYDRRHNLPNYVGEILTNDMITGNLPRMSRFYAEPLYTQITHATYTGSGYDRGHLAPAADFKGCKQGMYESFSICNVAPQKPKLNRQYWFNLEEYVRKLATKCDKLYVITGTISTGSTYINTVLVPTKFYKAVIGIKNNKKIISCAWVYRNITTKQSIKQCTCTIDELEAQIGLNLFPYLNRGNEKIESTLLIQ